MSDAAWITLLQGEKRHHDHGPLPNDDHTRAKRVTHPKKKETLPTANIKPHAHLFPNFFFFPTPAGDGRQGVLGS